jgi:hypothetical protein
MTGTGRKTDGFPVRKLRWLEQVADDPETTPTIFWLGFQIAKHLSRKTGRARPSQSRLAEQGRIGRRTVQRLTDFLVARGHLRVKTGDGRGHASEYEPVLKGDTGDALSGPKGRHSEQERASPESNKGRHRWRPNPFSEHVDEPGIDSRAARSTSDGDLFGEAGPPKAEPTTTVAEILPPSGVSGSFAEFWSAYPRHVAKGAARKAWERALKRAPALQIIAGARRYASERENENPQYTAHPASWLNADRWLDEPAPRHVRLNPTAAYLLSMRGKQ